MFFGTILSRAEGRSLINPGSYSIVVTAPVEPGTKMVIIPLVAFVFSSSLLI
jgi:hypothetical protein